MGDTNFSEKFNVPYIRKKSKPKLTSNGGRSSAYSRLHTAFSKNIKITPSFIEPMRFSNMSKGSNTKSFRFI